MIPKLEKYKKRVLKIETTINYMYSRLTFMSISDILDNNVDLRSLWDISHDLDQRLYKLNKEIYNWLEKNDPTNFDELQMEVDELQMRVSDKISAFSDLVDSLEDIVAKDDDYGIKKHFLDIKKE